ncbi:MAG: glycoside hydrolase family 20 zincin-like fold domain-containing protein, partial [Bacteroidetes bacterium]|nr:glycoside hydrolase family 20 zincin-like fold domain-containing protein [Bacteroidota bacterium]
MQQQYRAFIACLLTAHLMTFSLYAADTSYNIIPKPVTLETRAGMFRLSANMSIACSGTGSRDAALFFSAQLKKNPGLRLQPAQGAAAIRFSINAGADSVLGDEGYRLDISPTGIRLRANKPAGLFYAVQSLLQLIERRPESTA